MRGAGLRKIVRNVALVSAASIVLSCDSSPTGLRHVKARAHSTYVYETDAVIAQYDAQEDTVRACVAWQGCRDLTAAEWEQMMSIVQFLWQHNDGECMLTGSRIHEMLTGNKIKVGNTTTVWTFGKDNDGFVYPLYEADWNYIVMSPTQMGAIWEGRSRVIHEGRHAQGWYSTHPDDSIRQRLMDSFHEPEAKAHANRCTTE